MASKHGQLEVASLLLDAHASVQLPASSGHTPLVSAAEHGHAPLVKLLLGAGADLRAVTEQGRTALHLAAANCHEEVRFGVLHHLASWRLYRYIRAFWTTQYAVLAHVCYRSSCKAHDSPLPCTADAGSIRAAGGVPAAAAGGPPGSHVDGAAGRHAEKAEKGCGCVPSVRSSHSKSLHSTGIAYLFCTMVGIDQASLGQRTPSVAQCADARAGERLPLPVVGGVFKRVYSQLCSW